jgi:hypothetical protein
MRDTIELAREVYGAHTEWSGAPLERLESLFALVRADEREACAKEADKWSKRDDDAGAFIGKAIRNRGNT